MRVGFLSLALIIVVFAGAPGGLESATRTAFAQSQQPRNQTQPAEGLPAPQKKGLSRMGPEDVFPMNEQRENNSTNRDARGQPRRPTSTPAFPVSTPQRTPATSAPTPPATSSTVTSSAAPLQTAVETPSPAIGAVAGDSGIPPSLGQDDSTVKAIRWPVYGLIALALIVLALLIFTLTKLLEKIRETSVG